VSEIDLSICIVSYQARDYLAGCLRSLPGGAPARTLEVVVVDNGSTDGTAEMVRAEFPDVRLIVNAGNEGFTRPMNQALRAATGQFLVQLNPDTLVPPKALERLIAFCEGRPKAGICGPKVVNPDGTLQAPCRRGEPRPWAVISYFLKLHRLFPRSRFFGGYLLNHLDEDQVHAVDGVSGSCMLILREVVDRIGYLDEQFYAYQEDADYCRRAREEGWKVYYTPSSEIIHYGGEGGSRVHPVRSIVAWHRSYWLYYRKHLAGDYFPLFNGLYYGLMGLKLGTALLLNLLRRGRFARGRNPGDRPQASPERPNP
jgi:GT2 family glycosyltransferase